MATARQNFSSDTAGDSGGCECLFSKRCAIHRHGQRLFLPDEHDQLLAPRDPGIGDQVGILLVEPAKGQERLQILQGAGQLAMV